MCERGKEAIVTLLVEREHISQAEAEDIVREVQWQVNDVLAGESNYTSVAEVLAEFLGIGESYSWIFLYDNDETLLSLDIPGFEGTSEALDNLKLE